MTNQDIILFVLSLAAGLVFWQKDYLWTLWSDKRRRTDILDFIFPVYLLVWTIISFLGYFFFGFPLTIGFIAIGGLVLIFLASQYEIG